MASVIIIGFTIYKWIIGDTVSFNEIMSCSIVLSSLLSAITWGSREEGDGPSQEDELGQHITYKSAKISYFVLMALLLLALVADKWIFGRENMTLLLVFAISMIVLPLTEWIVSKQYR
ncbi:hypothetical protein [Brevibacillus reuszeri]